MAASSAEFYYGDFYPLTPYTQDNNAWIAWQFDGPERGEGAVQAFRRAESPVEQTRLKLRGLEPDATYTITVRRPRHDRGHRPALMADGLPIALRSKPAAAVVLYSRQR